MKITITEKQLKHIIKTKAIQKDVSEEESPMSDTPTDSTGDAMSSGDSSPASSYPSVGKWESGVTRGPGNQIGNTKWSDSVQIARGKANPLN